MDSGSPHGRFTLRSRPASNGTGLPLKLEASPEASAQIFSTPKHRPQNDLECVRSSYSPEEHSPLVPIFRAKTSLSNVRQNPYPKRQHRSASLPPSCRLLETSTADLGATDPFNLEEHTQPKPEWRKPSLINGLKYKRVPPLVIRTFNAPGSPLTQTKRRNNHLAKSLKESRERCSALELHMCAADALRRVAELERDAVKRELADLQKQFGV
ncbi:hypothetical protein D9758_008252 [Tetrapyrgos nigripes]|uniref:Uncharacterized protein n=1 Tax=Tetrapyrgos nigripes TaxID=182062 RepID=A0A8H5G1K6_9AGAR|nr:hypothetical protein D9758_008252 [Tetrapyrgos nigripes]